MDATVQARADYRSRFGNFRYRVEIVDSTQVTTNAREYDITRSGAVIDYESNEQDVYKAIIPSTCSFTLVCTTQAQIDFLRDVASSAVGRYGVRVLRADTSGTPTVTKWVGTLVSDQITFSDSLPQQIDLTATDDLGYLKDAPYLDPSTGNRFRHNQTLLQHIQQALKNTRTRWYYDYALLGFYNKELSYEDDLTPSEYVSAGSTVGFLEEAQVDNNMFYMDDDEELVRNSYEVLDMICKYLGATIYQSFEQDVPVFVMASFATFQKTVAGGYSATGKTYRSNGAIAVHGAATKSSVTITNDASNKKRLAGGSFTYLQPYRKVIRTLKVHEDDTLFVRTFKEGTAQGAGVRPFNDLYHSDYHNFNEGDQLRLRFVLSNQWNGDAAFGGSTAADTIYSVTGGAGSTPDAYKIGRIVVRVVIQLLNEDADGSSLGADQYAERVQSNGGQVPIYDTSYNFSSYPQFYTNHLSTDDIEFSTSSTHISFVTEPFVISQAQFIHTTRDLVLPAIPFDTANGIKVKCEVDFLDHTGAVAQNSGASVIEAYSNPKVVMIMRAFSGFEPSGERRFSAVNTGASRKSLNTGNVLLNDGFTQSLGIVRYRKSDGSYSPESTAFTSLMQSSNTYPSIKLIVSEMANFYGTHREMYEGTLIKMSDTGLNGIFSLTHTETGGTTTVKYKATKLSVNTGIEETSVSLVEIARNTTSTTGFTDVISPGNPITNGDDVAVGVGDIGGIYNLRSTIAENVAPVQALLATAVAANRSSQTGANIATIDANGVLQEVADGSNGHLLSTNGSGVYSFGAQSFMYMLASHSFMGSLGREDYYYYGSNFYGFSSFTMNSSASGISSINDQYAHNGIVVPYGFSRLVFKSTIRNDTNANDIDVTILKGARPNGSSSNITLTSLGTGSANNDAGVDLHYNCDIDITGLSITAGELIFVVFKRADGGAVNTTINVSYSLLAIT
jgi:hypothetical protein